MEGAGQEGSGAPGVGGAAPQGPRPSNKRLQQTQAQVDEVVGIMKVSKDVVRAFIELIHQPTVILLIEQHHAVCKLEMYTHGLIE
ncbi:unnamed protein product [Anisakis simplex]|uniref:Synapsin_C domain-containing protein n=1 Tax=Anisakis simplex TaxID=6269 RepID=A0A0M3IZW3_ANISI|nr:unnamed protein product [Anisakis simplex]